VTPCRGAAQCVGLLVSHVQVSFEESVPLQVMVHTGRIVKIGPLPVLPAPILEIGQRAASSMGVFVRRKADLDRAGWNPVGAVNRGRNQGR